RGKLGRGHTAGRGYAVAGARRRVRPGGTRRGGRQLGPVRLRPVLQRLWDGHGVHDGRIVGVRGRASDRVNHGRLGPKGLFGWQANNAGDRLTRPLVRSNGELREASWDDAMGRVVERSRSLLDEKGAGALGFYTSGQLFLEEYYT